MSRMVLKKNGITEKFNFKKIENAVELAQGRCSDRINGNTLRALYYSIEMDIFGMPSNLISVSDIHDIIIKNLKNCNVAVAKEYSNYRNYKKRFNKVFSRIVDSTKDILENGNTENANKDSKLISTQKELVSAVVSKEMTLEYELDKEFAMAHKTCAIHIHDLGDYIYNSFNCCLFDMGKLLKDGFIINDIKTKEPNSIRTALSIMSDVIINASSNQHGGFTVPQIDKVLGYYVAKSRKYYQQMLIDKSPMLTIKARNEWIDELLFKDLKQGIQSIEHKLCVCNNSNGQTPFTTFSYGIDTSEDARLVSKAILDVRMEGLGENKITAIFPKLTMLVRWEINQNEDSPNYDLYQQSIRTSMKRMYPDYISLNCGYLGEVYEKYGEAISSMGCRSFLDVYENEEGKAVFEGRGNCGVISLNLPQYAIRSDGDLMRFYGYIDKYLEMAKDIFLYKYEKMCKQKASSNPLFFVQGGCHIKLEPDESIKRAIDTFTWSIGYIGLDEVCRYMSWEGIHISSELAEEILDFINAKIDKMKKKCGLRLSLYGTPSENMCYRFAKNDKKVYGEIEGITDREYYTNSFHIHVSEKVNGIKKQNIEARFFHKTKGGRIIYNEYPQTNNFKAIQQSIDHAMDLGLYKGINLQLDSCMECNHQAEFKDKICPKCGSDNIISINRICGYLGRNDRMNKGKQAEIRDRVDHYEI